MRSDDVYFIQISDMHLFANEKKELLGVNTEESFQKILELVEQEKAGLDFLLLTGDLSQDASIKAYARLAEHVSKFNVPVYYVPGNHDNTKNLNAVYPVGNISNKKHIIFPAWQFILLDTHIDGKVAGRLDKGELLFLKECLQKYPDLDAVVIFHHQPVAVGCKWLDSLGISNATEFWQVIKNYPQVQFVLFGHIHQQYEQQIGRIQIYSAPSTCFQFMRKQDKFGLENLPPGMRKVRLCPNGEIKTEVIRTHKYIGKFDAKAKGY